MRLAIVTAAFRTSFGGLQTCTDRLVSGIAERCESIAVFALKERLEREPDELPDNVRVHRFRFVGCGQFRPSPSMWRAVVSQQDRFDVIHVFDVHTPIPVIVLSARRVPAVLTPAYHGRALMPVVAPPHRQYVRAVCARASRTICASEAESATLQRDGATTPGRTVVITPGIDSPGRQRKDKRGGERRRILTVGRLVAYKRVDRLIVAVAHLPELFELTVVGDGPDRGSLEALAYRLGIAHRVTFRGAVTDDVLPEIYTDHDIFVNLSLRESLGIVNLEAAGAGLSVVVSGIPAHLEASRRWMRGVMVLPVDANPSDIAGALLTPRLRSRLASPPTWSAYVDRHFELYQHVVADARVQPALGASW